MKARIFSLLLIVALLVGVCVFAVEAETFDPATTTTCPMCGETNVTWTEYACQGTTGHYYLSGDYTMTKQAEVVGNGAKVCLHLNGNTMTAKTSTRAFLVGTSKDANGNPITYTKVPVLNLMGGTIQGGATRFTGAGGLFYLHANGAELNIYEGVVIKATGTAAYNGSNDASVIYAGAGAVINMYGGTISGPSNTVSQAMNGGPVYVTGGKFNFYGGTINGNYSNKGGALSLFGGATFTMGYPANEQPADYVAPVMNGSYVSRNGGTVFMSGANTKFILNAGTINGGTQGTADAQVSNGTPTYREGGGAVFLQSSAIFEMNGGQILGGRADVKTAGYGGGAVCLRTGSVFNMNGGTIQGQKATYAGNSVFVADQGSVFNLNKGTIKAGTSAATRAGAVAVFAKGTLNVGKADGTSAAQDAQIIFDTNSGKTTNGGLIMASDSGSVVNLYNGAYLSGGMASGDGNQTGGGNIYNCASATVNMFGGTITGGSAMYVGSIYNSAIFNMSGGTITGGVAERCGGNVFNIGTFNMSGGTISGGQAKGKAAAGEAAAVSAYGGNVYTTGTFNMTGGTIEDGSKHADGQPIDGANVYASGTFTMSNNAIIQDGVGQYGANVQLVGGTFTMNGGEIKNGTATNTGGNINVYAGEFILNAGTISNGTTAVNALNGGCIYNGKTFTMNGGTISGGCANNLAGDITGGGAVYNASGATFTLNAGTITSGKGVFGGNVENFGTFNMVGGTITSGVAGYDGKGGNGGNIRANKGGVVTISGGEIKDGNAPTYGGNVYVNNGTVNFTNGTIKNGTANGGGNVFSIAGTFTMSQAEGKTTQILGGTSGTGYNGGSISVRGGTVNIQGGTVDATGGSCVTNGGAISVGWSSNTGATLNISGGVIKNGTAPTGGNIYVTAYGTVTMTGGTIQDGYATGTASGASSTVGGGNVFSVGAFTMSGDAKILDGKAVHSGGNVKVNGGTFTMNDGTVSGGKNEFTANNGLVGGGNFMVTAGVLDINGGTVVGGVAANLTNGGNIMLTNGTVNIDNATVQVTGKTKAANAGPNIYVRKNGTVELNIGEGAIITDEGYTLSDSARNIYLHSGVVNLNGGEIRSYSGGSSILLYSNKTATDGVLTLDGAKIINMGTTGASGKSISIDYGTLNLKSGEIWNGMIGGTSINMTAANTAKIIINISGDVQVDQLAIPGEKAAQPTITVAADFTGTVYFRPLASAVYDYVTFGYSVSDNMNITVAETYANTGSLYVGAKLGGLADYLPAAYSESELYITGLTKVVEGEMFDHATKTTLIPKELPVVSVEALNEGDTLKIADGNEEITLNKNIVVDTAGVTGTTINAADGVKVTLIDSANDNFETVPGQVTVNGGTVETYVHAENGNRYIVVYNKASNTYAAHRIEAKLSKVSIRPRSVGVYYTVEITCDSTLEAMVVNYGVAVSLNRMPDENFLTSDDVLYTYISTDDASFKSGEKHGALVDGIMTTGEIAAGKPTNAERANMPVYANAYVVILQEDGTETVLMADEDNGGLKRGETGWNEETAIAMSLNDIMKEVNKEANFEKLTDQAKASVQNFYNDWKEAANWDFDIIEGWFKTSQDNEEE